MRLRNPFRTMMAAAAILGSVSSARATIQVELQSGTTSVLLTEGSPSQVIEFSQRHFAGAFAIKRLTADSNSSFDGPTVRSELGIGAFTVKNRTDQRQTLTIIVSDVGFNPSSDERPLTVYNSASAHFTKGSGSLTFQTFAFDGMGYFRMTGPGTVATDPVILTADLTGGAAFTHFSPQNAQFSLTNVTTITLDPDSWIAGFSGMSVVDNPEPGALVLVCTGLFALGVGHRLRRRGGRAGEAFAKFSTRLPRADITPIPESALARTHDSISYVLR
jgi:hypothetical protein